MNEYMILVSESDAATAAEQSRLIEARAAYRQQLEASGAFLDAEQLRASTEARRVHGTGGRATVDKGPFEEALGSYWAVKAKDLDSAVALAKQVPVLPTQTVEVRPIMKGQYDAAKSNKPGKVFAFGVLGSAPNEEAWIRLMNRIDDESNDKASSTFPESFIAGVRLEAPRTGRRIVTQKGKPVVLDGPFLESKEVIGGLFFVRMASLEDAVEWASQSTFVHIGSAEIREVWRT